MSTQTFQVRADTGVPVDRSIFNLSALGSETMVDSDQGPVLAKSLTTQHRLKGHQGFYADVEWVERLDLSADDLNKYPDLKPVVIPAGYFGPGLPRRDTLLSPGQKLWAECPGGSHIAFGSARMLAPDPLQFRDKDIAISYIVVACSRPTMLNAEGMWLSC